MKSLFSRFGDWRLPLILAVPVVVWVVFGYLATRPMPGSSATANDVSVTIKENATPRPTYVPTPYPSVAATPAPVYAKPAICPTGVTGLSASAAIEGDQLVIRVVDQNGRAVACAWAIPQSGDAPFGGETDDNGKISIARSTFPAHFHFYDRVHLGSVSTGLYFAR